jgi:hypothetical protein
MEQRAALFGLCEALRRRAEINSKVRKIPAAAANSAGN